MAGKKRKQAVRGNQPRVPAWAWLLLGVVLGVILASWVFLAGYAPTLRDPDGPTPQPDATVPAPSKPGIAAEPDKESWGFYTELPERRVVIPEAHPARDDVGQPTAAGDKSKSTDSGSYVLQAGSFPSSSDANKLKARLALLGYSSQVRDVTIDGQTWHRVRLGPFDDAAALEETRNRLQQAGIKALALKE